MRAKAFLLLLCIVFISITCDTANAKNQVYKGRDYTISIPGTWEIKQNVGAAEFAALSPAENSSDKYRENVLIARERLPEKISIDKYLDVSISRLKTQIKNIKIISTKKLRVSGKPARKLIFVYGNLKMAQVYVIKNDTAYTLAFSSEPLKFSNYERLFNKILRSFRLK